MKRAFVFAGQGAQFPGMGKLLYDSNEKAKQVLMKANEIIGFDLADIMFEGSAEELMDTAVTQPSLFVHAEAQVAAHMDEFIPSAVAGHSLGEFSALVAAKVLSFKDGLELVMVRANAMQEACNAIPGKMAAVLGLNNDVVEDTCEEINGIVVAANYNCPGQLVISGEVDAVYEACELLKGRGARRALILPVGGAFHSPLMAPAREKLEVKINEMHFYDPICPVYQNVTGEPETDPRKIKENLIAQLTGPVKWTQTIEKMTGDNIFEFTELGGTGKVLSGLIRKINREVRMMPI